MYWLDAQVNFSEEAYTVYEHQGVLCLMLVLDNSAPTDFKVNISDVNYTATGKLLK